MGDRSGKWNIRPCIRPRDIAAVKRSCNLMFPVAEWLTSLFVVTGISVHVQHSKTPSVSHPDLKTTSRCMTK